MTKIQWFKYTMYNNYNENIEIQQHTVYMYYESTFVDSNFPYLNILMWLWQVCSHQWLLKQEEAKI